MLRRLASVALVPMKPGGAQLVDLVDGTKVVGVGYAGGASVALLLEVPVPLPGPLDMVTRSFRRLTLGEEPEDHDHYRGHTQVGPTTVFVYERVKP